MPFRLVSQVAVVGGDIFVRIFFAEHANTNHPLRAAQISELRKKLSRVIEHLPTVVWSDVCSSVTRQERPWTVRAQSTAPPRRGIKERALRLKAWRGGAGPPTVPDGIAVPLDYV